MSLGEIPEKVFVTGATGLLGQMLLKKLQEKKCKLGVLLEPALKASCTFSSEIDVIVGDITQPESYRYYLKDCTCVIHIAALTQVYPRSNPLCFKINTEAVNGLAQEVLKNGIQRFIHIGSASSFGSGTKHRINNEGSEFNLKAYRMDYINSKYEAQILLLKLYKGNVQCPKCNVGHLNFSLNEWLFKITILSIIFSHLDFQPLGIFF